MGRDGRAELHGDLEEAGGLAEDEVEVLFFVDEVAELLDLEELAFDHLLGERDEEVEDAEVALFEGGGEGLHVEPVAGEDALGVAPGGVGGGAAAAGVGLVDDVVVDEGGGVEHLDDGAEADAGVAGAAEGLGGEQEEQGADAFAAAGDEVLRDVGDDFDFGGGLAGELLLDGGEVVAEEVEDLGGGRDGESAHSSFRVTGWSIAADVTWPKIAQGILMRCSERGLVGAEVGELELDADVFAAQEGHDFLEDVAVFADDADGVALDAGLGFFLRVLDGGDDDLAFSEGMPWTSLIFWRTLELAAGSIFSYSRFLSETPRLTSFCERISMTALSLYSSWQASWMASCAFELDLGLGVLEVEAGVDLFGGLVDGVFDFLKFYFADYVEAVVGCHDVFLLRRFVATLLCQAVVSGCGEETVEVLVVRAASSSGEMPRRSARAAAVWVTRAGSLRWPRRGMGARKGASVSTRMRSAGAMAAASRMDWALG